MISIIASLLAFSIVIDVKTAATSGDLATAKRMIEQFQRQYGVTPESLEAYSWLARGALAAKKLDEAERFAAETRKQVQSRITTAKLDAEPHLPLALGAAIEVQGQVLNAREGRAAAVEYLRGELSRYRTTSIRTRIQKNINLLSLEGKPAPPLENMRLPANRPVLLLFWAHWCPDCKAEASVIAQMQQEFPRMAVIGPTQLYGYAEAGREVAPPEEKAYIAAIQREYYSAIREMPAPVSAENFRVYGASTTPTLVLIDQTGIVRLYRPGRLTEAELRPEIRKLMTSAASDRQASAGHRLLSSK